MGMRKKPAVPLTQKFPKAEPLALKLLERLLSFDPKDRPGAEEVRIRPHLLTLFTNFIPGSVNVIIKSFICIPEKWEYQLIIELCFNSS